VPLIVADPRRRWPWRVRESDAMVLNVDLSPTLCELGGAPPPEHIDGRSLLPLLRGEVESLRDAWFFEHRFHTRHLALARTEGLRTARWKYVRLLDEADRELLFDLEADPLEQRDLSLEPAFRATLADLRTRSFQLSMPARPEREPGAQNVNVRQRPPAAAPSPGAPSPAAAARRESRRRRARRDAPR
jgi:arylsulfatase A-like enzyme